MEGHNNAPLDTNKTTAARGFIHDPLTGALTTAGGAALESVPVKTLAGYGLYRLGDYLAPTK